MSSLLQQAQLVIVANPTLSLEESDEELVLRGDFILEQGGVAFDVYEIRLHVPRDFPHTEPKLFEVGQKIEKSSDFHVNEDGSACYEVFEYWLATSDDKSLAAFVRGPVHNFFLSQTVHRLTGKWPLGERSHGVIGLLEATADALGVEHDPKVVFPRLMILRDWPAKGHLHCPCGSGARFRDCHRPELTVAHSKVSPMLAERLIGRFVKYNEDRKKDED